jgi:hypothetical protein
VAVNKVKIDKPDETNELIATVERADTQNSSDLYYLWTKVLPTGGSESVQSWRTEEQGGNKFTVTSPGYYRCEVQQIIFNGTPDMKAAQRGDVRNAERDVQSLV